MNPDGNLAAHLARALQQTRRSRGLETALTVGGAVLDGWFGGDLEGWRSGQGARTLRGLSREPSLEVSSSTLYRYVAIAALCRRMGRTRFDHLGTSHLRQVLPLAPDEQVELITRAETDRWTVQQVAAQVRARRRQRRKPGRPIGSFLAGLPHLRRWARHPARLDDLHELADFGADRLAQLERLVQGAAVDLAVLAQAIDQAVRDRR